MTPADALAQVRAALPPGTVIEATEYDARHERLVVCTPDNRGVVSILYGRREWAFGLTYRADPWAVRHGAAGLGPYRGRGWLAKLATDAWAALNRAAEVSK